MSKQYRIDELVHHGIKGQKWGVRRFQKKDGSLTPAGKKRYDDSNEKPSRKERKELAKKQKDYDSKAEQAYIDAYNKAADKSYDIAKEVNKKYEKYDFSNKALKDPKQKAIFDKYIEEYNTKFEAVLQMEYSELMKRLGKRPE